MQAGNILASLNGNYQEDDETRAPRIVRIQGLAHFMGLDWGTEY